MMPMHGHGPGWRLPFILLALAGLSLAASSQEADNSGAGDAGTRVVVLVVGPGDSDTGDYVRELAASLGRALNAGGFVSETGESARLPLPEDIVALAESSGTPWIIVASCGLVDGKLVWQATGWDGKSGGIVAADSYSSYPGVGALPLIEESANNLVKAMTQSMKTAERPEPIAWPLRFSSPDEGAVVVLGPAGEDEDGNPVLPAGSINAGTIADGFLTAPYLPYFRGQKAMVTIMKPGFWPLTIAVPIKDDRPTRLPALKPKAHDAWGLDYGNGRILGIQAFYRYYLVPDLVFLEAGDILWAAHDFLPGSYVVFHDETRACIGFDPFFSPKASFRFTFSVGVSAVFTLVTAPGYDAPFALDLGIEPVRLGMEYHLPGMAFIFNVRGFYSLGLADGLIPRGWRGPFLSLGVMFK